VEALRTSGFDGAIFGGPSMGRHSFLRAAALAAEGVIFPLLVSPSAGTTFADRFEQRFGHAPDFAAVHSYDATWMLITAIREAGLNRAQIRDALVRLSPWPGASGTVSWDPLGQNSRPARVGTIIEGRVATPESR
jgi:branched-chain amino acid transport system substrate-binding protein